MSSKPSKTLAWIPSNDPTKIINPPAGKQSTGFLAGEKPASQYFNYVWNMVSDWNKWLYQGKFDFDNTLESMLLGVDFTAVGQVEKSTLVGYQSLDSTYNGITALGYGAIRNPNALAEGSTIIGYNATDGISLLNPSFVVGYENYQPLTIDFTLSEAYLNADLVISQFRSFVMKGASGDLIAEEVNLAVESHMKFSYGTNPTSSIFFGNPTQHSKLQGSWQLYFAELYIPDDSILRFENNTLTSFLRSGTYSYGATAVDAVYFGSSSAKFYSTNDHFIIDSMMNFSKGLFAVADGSSVIPASADLSAGGWSLTQAQQVGQDYIYTLEFFNTQFLNIKASAYRISDTNSDVMLYINSSGGGDSYFTYGLNGYIESDSVYGFRFTHNLFSNINIYPEAGVSMLANGKLRLGSVNNDLELYRSSELIAYLGSTPFYDKFFSVEERLLISGQLTLSNGISSTTDAFNGFANYLTPMISIDISADPTQTLQIKYLKYFVNMQSIRIGDKVTLSIKRSATQTIYIGANALVAPPAGFDINEDAMIHANGWLASGQANQNSVLNFDAGSRFVVVDLICVSVDYDDGVNPPRKVFGTSQYTYD